MLPPGKLGTLSQGSGAVTGTTGCPGRGGGRLRETKSCGQGAPTFVPDQPQTEAEDKVTACSLLPSYPSTSQASVPPPRRRAQTHRQARVPPHAGGHRHADKQACHPTQEGTDAWTQTAVRREEMQRVWEPCLREPFHVGLYASVRFLFPLYLKCLM